MTHIFYRYIYAHGIRRVEKEYSLSIIGSAVHYMKCSIGS